MPLWVGEPSTAESLVCSFVVAVLPSSESLDALDSARLCLRMARLVSVCALRLTGCGAASRGEEESCEGVVGDVDGNGTVDIVGDWLDPRAPAPCQTFGEGVLRILCPVVDHSTSGEWVR